MNRGSASWLGSAGCFMASWRFPAALSVVLLLVLGWTLLPQRLQVVVTEDGRHRWQESPPLRRSVIWEPAQSLGLPDVAGDVVRPQLAEGGTLLYFTLRSSDGGADIYQARRVDGGWQDLEPVAALNSPADDYGPVLAADGQSLYLYSNRSGGQGGFDLYVAVRDEQGWSAPRNLPPPINTPADEYDPALAPDGHTLYFASNRTPAMHARAHEADQAATARAWDATLRGDLGLPHFDLYLARRKKDLAEWESAEPLARLNRPDSNEGAPYVSPSGSFLYFASDRSYRPSESRNFDLYRAHLVDGLPQAAENLGPGVNTPADETEPALSAEGFTLVFSTNQEQPHGRYGIYRSAAREVFEEVAWDTRRLEAFLALGVWWKLLLVLLGIAALVALVWLVRAWLFERASSLRFFLASLLVNALAVLLLLLLPLGQEIVQQIRQIEVTVSSSEVLEESLHQSHRPGEQAWEKFADLEAPEQAEPVDTPRQITSLPSVPTQYPSPQAHLPRARAATSQPLERPAVVVAPEPPTFRAPSAIPRRMAAALAQPAAAPAVATLPVEPQQSASEGAVEVAVELVSAERPAPASPAPPEVSAREPSLPQASPGAMQPPRELARAAVAAARPVKVARAEAAAVVSPVAVLAQVELPPPAPSETENEPPEPTAELARRESSPGDVPLPDRAPAPSASPPPQWQAGSLAAPGDEPLLAAAAPVLQRVAARTPAAFSALVAELSPIAAAQPAGEEPAVEGRELALERAEQPIGLPAALADELTGPRRRFGQLEIGALAERPNQAPPLLGPLATRLARQPAAAVPVAYAEDNVGMEAMFTLRQADARRQFIELLGGNDESEKAVRLGLEWLAQRQHADGHWSLHDLNPPEKQLPRVDGEGREHADTAAVALALLPFLGAGHTHRQGDFQPTVAAGLQWLVEHQKPSGDLFTGGGGNNHMYSHGMAAIALSEAYGMTRDPALREPAQKALDFIVAAQHQPTGGWRYVPNSPGDTSMVGWQVMALKSGEMAGLAVPRSTLELAGKWIDSVSGSGPQLGRFGYQGPSGTPAMSAEALLCLQFLGARRNDPRLRAGADYLMANLPRKGQETSYYWYYGTQVMYHMQGKYWDGWNAELRDQLIGQQVKSGPGAGSWDPHDTWEQRAGRLYATSLRLLMLEVYYRHLPLYRHLQE